MNAALATPAPVRAPAPDRGDTGRFRALDGLRGLAAFAVLVHHCMLVDPKLSLAIFEPAGYHLSGWRDALTYSPLHLVWAGTEAVFVFFVLSGFVISLPFLSGAGPRWRSYYPRRLARLYLPVWAALVIAVVLAALVTRRATGSVWVSGHHGSLTATHLLEDAVLVHGTSQIDGPLWSLQWEVLFSLLLPLYLLVAVTFRRLCPVLAALAVLAVVVGYDQNPGRAPFLPMFLLGVLMAVHRHELLARLARVPHWAWPAITVVAVLLLLSAWTPLGMPRSRSLGILGAAGIVLVFLGWPAARRLGTSRVVAWLGAVSFSLYLVHEPIVVSVVLLTHTTSPAVTFAIAAPISLLVAWVFYRLVEAPAHRLSKRIGRWAAERPDVAPSDA